MHAPFLFFCGSTAGVANAAFGGKSIAQVSEVLLCDKIRCTGLANSAFGVFVAPNLLRSALISRTRGLVQR